MSGLHSTLIKLVHFSKGKEKTAPFYTSKKLSIIPGCPGVSFSQRHTLVVSLTAHTMLSNCITEKLDCSIFWQQAQCAAVLLNQA